MSSIKSKIRRLKNVLSCLFLVFSFINCSQISRENIIYGELTESKKDDTIHFTSGLIDQKYFDLPKLTAKVINGKFQLPDKITYPHLYLINLQSEKGDLLFRNGDYYLDSLTTSIRVDSVGECSEVIGPTHREFTTKFRQFFLGKNSTCTEQSISHLRIFNGIEFDIKLKEYVVENPDSFVALWNLVDRFNYAGYQPIHGEILSSFSEKMKTKKLWLNLSTDIKQVRIKENALFPVLSLKDINLKYVDFKLPDSNFILIDYWFSNCRPCLEMYPDLKAIYDTHERSEFEIISISTDKTKNIPRWKKAVNDLNLNWTHLLDENSVESRKDFIRTFPTTFLLNNKGVVIKKNPTIPELQKFLEKENR